MASIYNNVLIFDQILNEKYKNQMVKIKTNKIELYLRKVFKFAGFNT